MKQIDYIVWKEGKYYVSQCLNFEVSSFGESTQEAIENLKEAAELYLEGEKIDQIPVIESITLGREQVNA